MDIQDKYGSTALIWATRCMYIEIVRELIKAGADINIKDEYGKTALDYAKEKGYNDITKLLSKGGQK